MTFLRLDLLDKRQVDIILDLVDKGSITVAWAAIPCGTASKAREIPLANGRAGPRPLRSNEFPQGLPGLSTAEQDRVTKANVIYDHVSLILQAILDKGGLVAVENPRGSYVWQYKWFEISNIVTSNIVSGLQFSCESEVDAYQNKH